MKLSDQQQYGTRQSNGNTGLRKQSDGVRIKNRPLPVGFLLLSAQHNAPISQDHITIGFRVRHAGPVGVYLLNGKHEVIGTQFQHYCAGDAYEIGADLAGLPTDAVYYEVVGPDGMLTQAID
mgnify:CR=1 FL=1